MSNWYVNGERVNPHNVARRDPNYVPWQSVFDPSGAHAYPGRSDYPRVLGGPAPGRDRLGYITDLVHYEARRPAGADRYETWPLAVRGAAGQEPGDFGWYAHRRHAGAYTTDGYRGWRTAPSTPVRTRPTPAEAYVSRYFREG